MTRLILQPWGISFSRSRLPIHRSENLDQGVRLQALVRTILPTIGLTFFIGLSFPSPGLALDPPCQTKGSIPPIPRVRTQTVVKGLDSPLGVYHGSDGSSRLFIVEQSGRILTLVKGKLIKEPFLDIRDRVKSGGEKGLLGLAFHPSFRKTGRFFVNYTTIDRNLKTVISEFKGRDRSDQADPNSERILMSIDQPYSNHNGGQLAFGPDGFLYIGMGDGGAGNDPHGYAQDLSSLLGKMLRIDVDSPNPSSHYSNPPDNPYVGAQKGAPEIWASGLRNPWRFSFDPITHRLYLGDVGQDDREEINIIQKGKNYGWNIMEGTICTPGVSRKCDRRGLEKPILDYPRSTGYVVVGGYVYRGHRIPNLCGVYVYGDYGNGKIFGLRFDGQSVTETRMLYATGLRITSFGEDEDRELYMTDASGGVHRIIP